MSNNIKNFSKKISTGYYLKGYHKLRCIENKQYEEINLENFEDGDNPYDDAWIFLHGSCQLFALALQRKYGYLAVNLQINGNSNAHYFCQSSYKGKTVYIDVRGITTDLNDVISEFIYKDYDYKIIKYNFGEERLSKADEHGLKFAEQIIEDNPEFYDVNRLESFEKNYKFGD